MVDIPEYEYMFVRKFWTPSSSYTLQLPTQPCQYYLRYNGNIYYAIRQQIFFDIAAPVGVYHMKWLSTIETYVNLKY